MSELAEVEYRQTAARLAFCSNGASGSLQTQVTPGRQGHELQVRRADGTEDFGD